MECWLYKEKPFDKCRAFIDLLLLANHSEKKINFGGKPTPVKSGQYLTSIEKLSDRWGWSRNKVKRFLDVLENDNMIITERTNRRTSITIVNYCIYQGLEFQDEPTHEPSVEPTIEPTDGQETNQLVNQQTNHKQEYKNIKNDKNDKECKEEKKSIKDVSNDTSSSHSDVRQSKYQWLIDEWNALSAYGIKPIRGFTENSNRLNMVRARISQFGEDAFREAIENVKNSSFLQGKGNRGFTVTFDWFIKPTNFPKVLEGNYNDRDNTTNNINKSQQTQLDWLMNSIREDEQNESNGNQEDRCVDGRFVP